MKKFLLLTAIAVCSLAVSAQALIECDGTVNLNGGLVRSGGKLTIKAKNIKIGSGFKVEAGGKFKIEKIN